MISFPNAKINIGLSIVNKREDGFHNIETVFYPIPITDCLEIVENKNFELVNFGLHIDAPQEKNLCFRAYQLINDKIGIPPVKIILQKHIPFGAGLGGGSSNAAFVLKMLNEFFKLNISDQDLEQYAASIGSDCAFFIKNKPVFAHGRGELFEEVNLSLSGKVLVLIKPDVHVSTKEAYAGVVPKIPQFDLRKIASTPIHHWKDLVVNDFEKSIIQIHSELEQIKEYMYNKGALYAAMSGSGSTIFGIFEGGDEPDLSEYSCYTKVLKLS